MLDSTALVATLPTEPVSHGPVVLNWVATGGPVALNWVATGGPVVGGVTTNGTGGVGAAAVTTGSAVPVGYSPANIKGAYGISGVTGNGAGQTIAIVDPYNDPDITNDLNAFSTYYGLPTTSQFSFYVVNQNGGNPLPGTDPNGPATNSCEAEEALDVEWAHAIAPQASIVLYEANSNGLSDLMTAVNTARSLAGVSVVSMSWGGSEFSGETAYDADFTTPAGHAGVTFVASTGDTGTLVNGGSPGVPDVEWPAASPNVVAVGGTSLTINTTSNTWASETTWGATASNPNNATGGGQSTYESEPTYQDEAQQPNTGHRQVPDVAFDADPNTGVAVYDSYDYGNGGAWAATPTGGTSVGAPCWSGLIAIANQQRANIGLGPLDGPSQTLPDLYATSEAGYHDITTGNNHVPGDSGYYSAGANYDKVTGRGTPVANALVTPMNQIASPGLVQSATYFLADTNSFGNGTADFQTAYGATGWVPLAGNWTGNGTTYIGAYDPSTFTFYLADSNASNYAYDTFTFTGLTNHADIPVVGHWNGGADSTVGLYDPATSDFYLRYTNTTGGAQYSFGFGSPGAGWLPIAGNWTGTVFTYVGLYNPANSNFYLSYTDQTGAANNTFGFGAAGAGWLPIAGDWTGTGTTRIGLYNPTGYTVYERNSLTTGAADVTYQYGPGASCVPIAGAWGLPGTSQEVAQGGPATPTAGVVDITAADLQPIVSDAIAQWAAQGASQQALAVMGGTSFQVGDLVGGTLARGVGDQVLISDNAAGYGWFVDPSPSASSAFGPAGADGQLHAVSASAVDRIDLFTVVENELGAIAGLSELASSSTDLMSGTLGTGVRRLPSAADAALLQY